MVFIKYSNFIAMTGHLILDTKYYRNRGGLTVWTEWPLLSYLAKAITIGHPYRLARLSRKDENLRTPEPDKARSKAVPFWGRILLESKVHTGDVGRTHND